MDTALTAIVPLKALADAKQRLSVTLTPCERRELTTRMFERVTAACRAAACIGRVVAVTGDADATALAGRCGLEVIVEPAPGLSCALAAADDVLAGEAATLVLVADLPFVTGDDLDALHTATGDAQVVVAPTHDGGTGALLRRPPGVIPTAFGPRSAARHLELARRAGLRVARVDRPGLATDLDTPAQLREARCWPSGGDGRTLAARDLCPTDKEPPRCRRAP